MAMDFIRYIWHNYQQYNRHAEKRLKLVVCSISTNDEFLIEAISSSQKLNPVTRTRTVAHAHTHTRNAKKPWVSITKPENKSVRNNLQVADRDERENYILLVEEDSSAF